MIRQYEYYGYLPIWQLWGQDNYCMIGNHSIPVITDAILKGIPGIDMEKAYEAVYNSSVTSHPNSPFEVWEKYGLLCPKTFRLNLSPSLWSRLLMTGVLPNWLQIEQGCDISDSTNAPNYYRNLSIRKQGSFSPRMTRENGSNLSTRINTVETAGIRLPKEMHGNTFGMFRITSRP